MSTSASPAATASVGSAGTGSSAGVEWAVGAGFPPALRVGLEVRGEGMNTVTAAGADVFDFGRTDQAPEVIDGWSWRRVRSIADLTPGGSRTHPTPSILTNENTIIEVIP